MTPHVGYHPGVSTPRLALVAAACVLLAAVLLALAAALDSPGVAVGGAACVFAALLAREIWRWRASGPLDRLVTAAAALLALAVLLSALVVDP